MPWFINRPVSYPTQFEALDRHINDPETRETFYRGLAAGKRAGFSAGGPFAGDTATRDHWATDWIDRRGHGGKYWPYLDALDLKDMFAKAFLKSVRASLKSGKIHNTLWVVHGEPPEEFARGKAVSKAKQRRLFIVAVEETDQVVNVVIVTPKPIVEDAPSRR